MWIIKKEPLLAKGVAQIDKRPTNAGTNNLLNKKNSNNFPEPILHDARVLHLLKKECQRTGAGKATLNKVFTGLLSVHNSNLTAFADALKMEEV